MEDRSLYRAFGKRALDICVSSLLLVVLSPFLVGIAALVRLESRGPALFRQVRSGADNESFTILKFRTMPIDSPTLESAYAAGLAFTRIGKTLRRLSLDELPQLFNVLANQMSLVGPRPALPTQEELLSLRTQNGAIQLKPGMTGLAQINGYDGMSNEEKARLDGVYGSELSFRRDLTIIARTIGYLRRTPPSY